MKDFYMSTSVRYACRIFGLAFGAALLTGSALAQEASQAAPGDPQAGERLYRTGIGADGAPVTAVTQGDIAIDGSQLTCVSCHRPSGMGTSEGGTYVPPITAGHLFNEREITVETRNDRFKEYYKDLQSEQFYQDVMRSRQRPAYDAETLARAVTEGVDAAGKPLNPVMPRYRLSERDARDLVAYLQTLSDDYSPGVGEERIQFATIVTDGHDEALQSAFIDTVQAYVEWVNKDLQKQIATPGFSPFYRSEFSDSYRYWDLDVWRLSGPPESWGEQLRAYYEAQPPFAVISGLVDGRFDPIAQFCDHEELPCLFPVTDLPPAAQDDGGYTLYFSRGMALEGEAAAEFLAQADGPPPELILQLYLDDEYGRAASEAFAARAEALLPDTRVATRMFPEAEGFENAITRAAGTGADVLVLWPGREAEAAITVLAEHNPEIGRIILPMSAVDIAEESIKGDLRERTLFTWRYADPAEVLPESYRARAWMRARRLPIVDWDRQVKAFFATRFLEWAMEHMLTDYYRDYLIEIMEHGADNAIDPGPHHQLTLGPGQRFGSKTAFLVRLDDDGRKGLRAVSPPIIP